MQRMFLKSRFFWCSDDEWLLSERIKLLTIFFFLPIVFLINRVLWWYVVYLKDDQHFSFECLFWHIKRATSFSSCPRIIFSSSSSSSPCSSELSVFFLPKNSVRWSILRGWHVCQLMVLHLGQPPFVEATAGWRMLLMREKEGRLPLMTSLLL